MPSAEDRLRVREAALALRKARPDLTIRQAHHLIAPLVGSHPRASAAKLVELVGEQDLDDLTPPPISSVFRVLATTALGWLVFGAYVYIFPSQLRFAYVLAVALAALGGAFFGRREATWFLLSALAPLVALVILVLRAQDRPGPRRGGGGSDGTV